MLSPAWFESWGVAIADYYHHFDTAPEQIYLRDVYSGPPKPFVWLQSDEPLPTFPSAGYGF